MNPGRNDPCPCGSGKKYKKCCLLKKRDADSFILGLNNLYALVKTINTQLITKSNKSDYSIANFCRCNGSCNYEQRAQFDKSSYSR